MLYRSLFLVALVACTTSPAVSTLDEPLVTAPKTLSASTGTNASTLALNFGNNVAVDGHGVIHVVWTEGTASTGAIAYTRSTDNGATWAPPLVFGTCALLPSMRSSLGPRIAAAGDDVYIAWHGSYEAVGRIYLMHLLPGGGTVGPTPISDAGIGASFPSIAASGSTVAIVWSDNRGSHAEIRARVSRDRAATFAPSVPVSVPDAFSSWTPAVAVQGSEVHVAWTDERHDTFGDCADRHDSEHCYEEEYYRRSPNGGVTWDPEVRLTTDAGAPKSSWAPTIAVAGDVVHVAYFDFRTGIARIYHQRSTDRGVHWGGGEQLISSSTDTLASARPVLSVIGANVRVVFWRQSATSLAADVQIAASSASGAAGSWVGPYALTTNIGGAGYSSLEPQVALSPNGSNHVVWMDNRSGKTQVMYVRVD